MTSRLRASSAAARLSADRPSAVSSFASSSSTTRTRGRSGASVGFNMSCLADWDDGRPQHYILNFLYWRWLATAAFATVWAQRASRPKRGGQYAPGAYRAEGQSDDSRRDDRYDKSRVGFF